MNPLSRAASEWRKARAAWVNRGILRGQRHLMQPGLWVFSGWELWFRLGSTLPKHLLVSKGNRRGPLLYRLVKMMLSPLYWFIVWPRGGEHSPYLAAVRGPNKSRETILFSASMVLRILKQARDPEQIELREVWDRYVSNSRVISELTNGPFFVEELIQEDTTATQADFDARTAALLNSAAQYSLMLTQESFGVLGDHREEILHRLSTMTHRVLIERAIEAVGEENFWALPLLPMGSDASPDNALISSANVAFFVDTEPIYLRPSITHPISLIAAWDDESGTLVNRFLDGEFDHVLESLVSGSSVELTLSQEHRMAWMVLAIATPFIRPAIKRRRIRQPDKLLDHYNITVRAKSLIAASRSV